MPRYLESDETSTIITMLELDIDRSDQTALHEQVAEGLRNAIAAGEAKVGERLPPAKDFAFVLGVNVNTVLRAMHQLRSEGILEFQRGRGITVAGSPQHGLVIARAREFVRFARKHGFKGDELVRLVEQVS